MTPLFAVQAATVARDCRVLRLVIGRNRFSSIRRIEHSAAEILLRPSSLTSRLEYIRYIRINDVMKVSIQDCGRYEVRDLVYSSCNM